MRLIDITGQKFGMLTVVRFSHREGMHGYRRMYLCKCDCGKDHFSTAGTLRYGQTTSCGCKRYALIAKAVTKHGASAHGKQTREHRIWCGMKTRCGTPTVRLYKNYGARGIKVCERWKNSFENFLADMGKCPTDQHSIERINNDGNYEPGNCRWATRSEQCNNRRSSRIVEFAGQRHTLAEWGRLGFNERLIGGRLLNGWSVNDAFTRPVYKSRKASELSTVE